MLAYEKSDQVENFKVVLICG